MIVQPHGHWHSSGSPKKNDECILAGHECLQGQYMWISPITRRSKRIPWRWYTTQETASGGGSRKPIDSIDWNHPTGNSIAKIPTQLKPHKLCSGKGGEQATGKNWITSRKYDRAWKDVTYVSHPWWYTSQETIVPETSRSKSENP